MNKNCPVCETTYPENKRAIEEIAIQKWLDAPVPRGARTAAGIDRMAESKKI